MSRSKWSFPKRRGFNNRFQSSWGKTDEEVWHSHGYELEKTSGNIGCAGSGDNYSREAELSLFDIAIIGKGSDKVLARIEIEETNDTPKTYLGDLFGAFLGDHSSFRGECELSVGEFTILIVLGRSKVPHGKRNECLREKGMKIKSNLPTANSHIGNIMVDTFADEKGLYAFLSTILDKGGLSHVRH